MTRITPPAGAKEHMSSFISRRRKELGLTLQALAFKIGSSKSYVWEIEQGRTKEPSIWMILRLCNGLNCDLYDMLGIQTMNERLSQEERDLVEAHRKQKMNEAILRHQVMELVGVIEEYKVMPCASLLERMYSQVPRALARLQSIVDERSI